jgi:hypothetical protein
MRSKKATHYGQPMSEATPPELQQLFLAVQKIILSEVYARVAPIRMLAHYTSLDAFKSILRSKEFWLCQVRDMNDTSEMIDGAAIVTAALVKHSPQIFKAPIAAEMEIVPQFEARRELLETDTYALSLSEHGTDEETDRLVMWRAYGHDGNGLCLVLRKDTLLGQSAAGQFPIQWTPIEYASPQKLTERVQQRLQHLSEIFSARQNFVSALPPKNLGMLIVQSVVQLVVSHKHLAFKDEHEVRFIRSRLLQSSVLPEGACYRTIGTREKSIFAIPLREYPEYGIKARLEDLLDHIIVGPSDRQETMYREVRNALDGDGLNHVPIRLSGIPYRPTRQGS